MSAATFWISHQPSDSRALVEFMPQGRQFKVTIFFIKGNVMNLDGFRLAKQKAREMLLW